jgi:hypothetical protein
MEHTRKDSRMPYTIRPLDAATWAAFAELVERNKGIFGGCWLPGIKHRREYEKDAPPRPDWRVTCY